MKYEIIALFDDDSNDYLEDIKKSLCKKYKLNKFSSNLYIEIGSILNPNMDILNKVLSNILNPYKNFKVLIENTIQIDNKNKVINLQIENKGYISRISRNITDTLDLHGFDVNKNCLNTNFSIPMLNANSKTNYHLSNISNNISLMNDTLKVNRIEIWKQITKKREVLIKSYPLRKY